MHHSFGPRDWAADTLRRAVEQASGSQPMAAPAPRHRAPVADERTSGGRWAESSTRDPRIVFSPDPGRFPRGPQAPADREVGFRSTQDVSAMSPVIYRPGGGDRRPDRDRPHGDDQPTRVPIAPPGIPTAGSYSSRPSADEFDEDPDFVDVDMTDDDMVDDDFGGAEVESEQRSAPAVSMPARLPRPKRRRRRDQDDEENEPVEAEAWHAIVRPPAQPAAAARVEPPADPVDVSDTIERVEAVEPPASPEPPAAAVPPTVPPRYAPPPPQYTQPPSYEAVQPTAPTAPAAPTALPDESPEPRPTLRLSAPPVGAGDVEGPSAAAPLDPQWHQPAPPMQSSAPQDHPVDDVVPVVETTSADEVRLPREEPAVMGRVSSTRGRGVQGLTVALVDDGESVVAVTTTGRRGDYAVYDVFPGSYRVLVTDDHEDFADTWYAGATFDEAAPVEVDDDRTATNIDATVQSQSVLESDVELRRRKAILRLSVTELATGEPARGTVRVTTDYFSADLPLVKGEAEVTIFGSAREWGQGVPRLPKKVRLQYTGTKHTAPTTRTAKLR